MYEVSGFFSGRTATLGERIGNNNSNAGGSSGSASVVSPQPFGRAALHYSQVQGRRSPAERAEAQRCELDVLGRGVPLLSVASSVK